MAAALVCGLLTTFHSGVYDDVLLHPIFVMIGARADKALRILTALILFPVASLAQLAGIPAIPVLLLGWLGMAVFGLYQSSGEVSLRVSGPNHLPAKPAC